VKETTRFFASSGINELKCQQTGQIEGGTACPVRSCDMMTPGLVHLWTFGRQFSAQLAFMMQQPEMLFFGPIQAEIAKDACFGKSFKLDNKNT